MNFLYLSGFLGSLNYGLSQFMIMIIDSLFQFKTKTLFTMIVRFLQIKIKLLFNIIPRFLQSKTKCHFINIMIILHNNALFLKYLIPIFLLERGFRSKKIFQRLYLSHLFLSLFIIKRQ
jgi:hypothetical protein